MQWEDIFDWHYFWYTIFSAPKLAQWKNPNAAQCKEQLKIITSKKKINNDSVYPCSISHAQCQKVPTSTVSLTIFTFNLSFGCRKRKLTLWMRKGWQDMSALPLISIFSLPFHLPALHQTQLISSVLLLYFLSTQRGRVIDCCLAKGEFLSGQGQAGWHPEVSSSVGTMPWIPINTWQHASEIQSLSTVTAYSRLRSSCSCIWVTFKIETSSCLLSQAAAKNICREGFLFHTPLPFASFWK